MTDAKTIAFFPEPGAWGPTNNCVAIANVLSERGHRIVFVIDESFEGVLEAQGFEERLMRHGAARGRDAEATADPWAEFIRVTAPEFRKPTIEQIETVTKPIWEALVGGRAVLPRARHGDLGRRAARRRGHRQRHRLPGRRARRRAVGALRLGEPARDARRRPAAGALRTAGCRPERVGRVRATSTTASTRSCSPQHNDFRASVGVDPCPPDEFNTYSPWLNLYLFPEAADYDRAEPLDATWHRLQSTVRTSDAPFDVARAPAR